MRTHCGISHSFVCSWSLSHNSLITRFPNLHTFQPNSDAPDVYAKEKVPWIHSWMWRPRWPAADAREMFLNLATGAKPEGRAELCSTENKSCSGIRWLTQVHLKPARKWMGWAMLMRLEERERTATNPARWNKHCRDDTTLPSHFSHVGKTRGSPLGAAVLFHACPSPTVPSLGSSSAGARAELQSIPAGDGTARMCCMVKGFTY